MRAVLGTVDNNQPGDVVKGCKIIVDVLTRHAGNTDIPTRLVLGSDCWEAIKEKCSITLRYLEEEKDLIWSTDFEKA